VRNRCAPTLFGAHGASALKAPCMSEIREVSAENPEALAMQKASL